MIVFVIVINVIVVAIIITIVVIDHHLLHHHHHQQQQQHRHRFVIVIVVVIGQGFEQGHVNLSSEVQLWRVHMRFSPQLSLVHMRFSPQLWKVHMRFSPQLWRVYIRFSPQFRRWCWPCTGGGVSCFPSDPSARPNGEGSVRSWSSRPKWLRSPEARSATSCDHFAPHNAAESNHPGITKPRNTILRTSQDNLESHPHMKKHILQKSVHILKGRGNWII